jgi:hypothetical protein
VLLKRRGSMPNLDNVGTDDDDDDDVMSFIEEIARLIRESDGTEQGSLPTPLGQGGKPTPET